MPYQEHGFSIEEFAADSGLPDAFLATARQYYLPLAEALATVRIPNGPLFLGINGAQGTGKSTLAAFLKDATASLHDWNVAVLSIDDFYLTRSERSEIASSMHPLLQTRGVPGTHDTTLLANSLQRLFELASTEDFAIPRFDKSTDDRADESEWPLVTGPLDMIILEGWCVGSRPQSGGALDQPVNELESNDDSDARWRHYVNEKLRRDYAPIFKKLDALIFLRAPSIDAIKRWRLQQEHELAARAGPDAPGIMSDDGLLRFLQHYERITESTRTQLEDAADVVFELDEFHQVAAAKRFLLT